MSVIKCKMCGGDLELIEGSSVAVCEYCGTQQTVPAADNEKKLTLFARANRLRLACEFDKAAGVYESIVADFPTEAEAYWGLVLCRYGIEYVDDPATGKKIPTCHRSSFDSVMEDSDFEQALENADAVARRVYRDEAKAIEELRRGIVEASGKEPPYDIFICYKETAEDGQRTVDSVIAQDVYDALTEKGYRVFFSRISLEDKLGTEYEPYIFAALHSAKIMLAFGTDYEYYNAVWVKNEWSRYLQLMTKDKSKHLIPCYKNLDAYDMPKEFAKLQAQDMGKVGAMQDLLRGVDKIMGKGAVAAPTAANTASNATVDSLLDRAWMFLEDSDYQKAHEYLERVLDIDPRNSRAYLGNVLAALRIPTLAAMDTKVVCLDSFKDFERAMRFASESERQELENVYDAAQKKYLIKCVHVVLKSELKKQECRQRKEEEENRKREAQLEAAYHGACERMSKAADEEAFRACAEAFVKIQGYRDADELRTDCLNRVEECRKDIVYDSAVAVAAQKNPDALREAAKRLAEIPGWRDADELRVNYLRQAEELEAEEQHRREEERITAEKRAVEERLAAERKAREEIARNRRNRRTTIIGIVVTCICIALASVLALVIVPNMKKAAVSEQYDDAFKAANIGDVVAFGAYKQGFDGSNNKEKIEWLVLAKEENRILVISKYVLDCQKYYTSFQDITWDACSLRTWLNDEFLNSAFIHDEQMLIAKTAILPGNNPTYETDAGKETTDRVFLLSIDEAEKYFASDAERVCSQTPVAERRAEGHKCYWWLRSPGNHQRNAACVYPDGTVNYDGLNVNTGELGGVRPAMWITW